MKIKFCEKCGHLIKNDDYKDYREYTNVTEPRDAYRAIRDYEEGRTRPLQEFIEELEAEGEL